MDVNFVGIYELNETPCIRIPYHQAKNTPMLFDVIGKRSVPITINVTPSDNRMYTSVHNYINQNPTADHKDLLVYHQLYGHAKMKW